MPNSDLFDLPQPQGVVISVSELNRRARTLIESNLELMWVAGEISNAMRAASGHWYFTLKDENAQVRCVMFRNKAALLGFTLENGMQVEVRALPSLYEARGEFQLGVETLRRAGLGALYEAFERLKAKLSHEGLFAEERKKPIPRFPRALGIVTSSRAAALRDVLSTLRRRAPMVDIVIYPTAVQGAGAAEEIAAALAAASQRGECDALVLCRGGGSIEDLWPFNDERVARAIAACALPIVSGVGHETDFTIADFVADRRAPTPTAAAELVSPNRDDLAAEILARRGLLLRAMRRIGERAIQSIDRARRGLVAPGERLTRERDRVSAFRSQLLRAAASAIRERSSRLDRSRAALHACGPGIDAFRARFQIAMTRLEQVRARRFDAFAHGVEKARAALDLLNPRRTLERGYSIVSDCNGAIVRRSADAPAGTLLAIRFAQGGVAATVNADGGDADAAADARAQKDHGV